MTNANSLHDAVDRYLDGPDCPYQGCSNPTPCRHHVQRACSGHQNFEQSRTERLASDNALLKEAFVRLYNRIKILERCPR